MLTPDSELDLSLLAKAGCGAFRTDCVAGGLVVEIVCPLREFSDPFALGGGDCGFRVSIFSDKIGCDGAEWPSEVWMFRFTAGNADGAGALFFDFPNKKDMLQSKQAWKPW